MTMGECLLSEGCSRGGETASPSSGGAATWSQSSAAHWWLDSEPTSGLQAARGSGVGVWGSLWKQGPILLLKSKAVRGACG